MANRSKGKPFVPGVSGNPNGRPKTPDDLKEALKMTRVEFQQLLVKYLAYDLYQLAEKQKDPRTTALDRIVISVITNAIKKGDQQRLDFLMNRIIGKVRDEIDHTSGGSPVKAVLVLPSNGRELGTD